MDYRVHDMNDKLLKEGIWVILYSLIGNQGSDIVGVGPITRIGPANSSPSATPLVWVDGYAAHYPEACVAIYPHLGKLLKATFSKEVTPDPRDELIRVYESVIAFYADPQRWSRQPGETLYQRIDFTDCHDYPHITRDVRLTGGDYARKALAQGAEIRSQWDVEGKRMEEG